MLGNLLADEGNQYIFIQKDTEDISKCTSKKQKKLRKTEKKGPLYLETKRERMNYPVA